MQQSEHGGPACPHSPRLPLSSSSRFLLALGSAPGAVAWRPVAAPRAAVLPAAGAGRPAVAGGDRRVPGQRVGRRWSRARGRPGRSTTPAACIAGLYITGAWFKRDLGEDWIKILNDARVSELFVPYHQHSYVRYYDLTSFSFPLAEVKAEDAGPFGTIMPPFQGDTYATVVKEMRDRGIAWKDYAHGVRRGRELVLWGGLQAGNYMYLMSYSFHDDGTIALRVGATGQNLPGQRARGPRPQRPLAHRHGPGRRQQELGDADAARRGPREPGRRGREGAVQRRHGRRRRLGPEGIHDDPGRVARRRTRAARRSPTT